MSENMPPQDQESDSANHATTHIVLLVLLILAAIAIVIVLAWISPINGQINPIV